MIDRNPETGDWKCGNPVFNEYAFLPDIRLQLKLRGVYMAGAQVEQPVYLGGKVRAAHRMAQLGEDIAVENYPVEPF